MVSVSSWISPKARKGTPSAIAGRGLFAVEPIAGGEVVAVKGGHIVDTQTMRSLPEKLRNSEIQIAEGLHLVALTADEYEPVMLFINHSCEPNVGFAGNEGARSELHQSQDDHPLPVVDDGVDDQTGAVAVGWWSTARGRSPATPVRSGASTAGPSSPVHRGRAAR